MSKIIFLQNRRREQAPAPDAPREPAKILQRNPLTQAERDRELRAGAARYFAEELARNEAELAHMRERGEKQWLIQAMEEQVKYYAAELARVTPAETEREERAR